MPHRAIEEESKFFSHLLTVFTAAIDDKSCNRQEHVLRDILDYYISIIHATTSFYNYISI